MCFDQVKSSKNKYRYDLINSSSLFRVFLFILLKIYAWVPEPGDIVDKVANWTKQPVAPVDAAGENIYITCNGADASDVDAIGPLMFYSILHPNGHPTYGGLPYYFFPYL